MLDGYVDHISRHTVEGWALNTDSLNQSIDVLIMLDGVVISRVTANLPRPDVAAKKKLNSIKCGFSASIPTFLDTSVMHRIEVRFADTKKAIANGERQIPSLDDYDDAPNLAVTQKLGLSPLIVTHMPRSGSTMCMSLLHRHPSIVVAEHYPFEVKPATYYARAARLLTEPGNHDTSASPTEFMRSSAQLGFNPFKHFSFDSVFRDPRLRDHYFERSSRLTVFSALREVASDYYRHLAADQEKLSATYFAEKCEAQGGVRRSLMTLFPEASEILLIRDPRDLLCSNLSYFKKPMDTMMSNMQNGCKTIEQIASEKRKRTLIVKYESLVFDQLTTLKAIARFLGIDAEPWSEVASLDAKTFRRHATKESPEESVGRWRQELSKAQKDECTKVFSAYLSGFGYDAAQRSHNVA